MLGHRSFRIGAAVLFAAAGSTHADVIRVSETDFLATAGLITFSEFTVGTANPTYAPADYGGNASLDPTVTFDGWFAGQSLSANPTVDCPGAAATGCVVGSPTDPLTLDAASPDTFIASDGSAPNSPVLSGTPQFNGPIAVLFDKDQAGVGFDAGFFNAENSTAITAFARDGNLLGSVLNTGLGIEFLGLVTSDGQEQIAGVFLDLQGSEPAGFAIDSLRFAKREDIIVPPVPIPAALPLFGSALGLFGFLGWKRRNIG